MAEFDPSPLLELCETILEDGEASAEELYALAEWLNNQREASQHWPGNVLVVPLQEAWNDGKLTKTEIRRLTSLLNRIRREWAKSQKVRALERGQELAEEAARAFDLARPILPCIKTAIPIKSHSERGVFYEVDLSGPCCNCPDWSSRRKGLPVGHPTRCCKHVLDAYEQIEPQNGWPGWLGGFLENSWTPHPQQQWMAIKIGNEFALVSTAPAGWANVFALDGSTFDRFGFNPEQDRWAYGIEPPGASQIVRAIRAGPLKTVLSQQIPPPLPRVTGLCPPSLQTEPKSDVQSVKDFATDEQKQKLNFFHCEWTGDITQIQAEEMLTDCAAKWPDKAAQWKYLSESLGAADDTHVANGEDEALPPPLPTSIPGRRTGLFAWFLNKLDERRIRRAKLEFERTQAQLRAARARQMFIEGIVAQLRAGHSPGIQPGNFILQPGERFCWAEHGTLHELRVVARRYEGGSQGVSFRVAKGVRFTVGAHRGRSVSETGFVPVSVGDLILTDNRLVFVGDGKSIATNLEKLMEVQPALDGIRFCDSKSSKPRIVRYTNSTNGDIVCAVLNFLIER